MRISNPPSARGPQPRALLVSRERAAVVFGICAIKGEEILSAVGTDDEIYQGSSTVMTFSSV